MADGWLGAGLGEVSPPGERRARRVSRSVTDEAIDKIKQLIVTGRLSPGQRLPPEKELAVQLGLSRSSLREAVRALALLRVVDARQGDGTYISSLRPELLLGVLDSAIDLLQDRTLVEVFEVRRVLEPAATALAAARITDAELEGVRECLRAMETLTDPEQFVAMDLEFHDRLVRAAGNATLAALARSFSAQTVRVRVWRLAAVEGVPSDTRSQHEAIYRAVAAGDAQLALAAATVHVNESELWLARLLEQTED